MRKRVTRFASLLALLGFGILRPAQAQTVYTPMTITSGYNADVIADNNGVSGGRNTVASSTTATVDRGNATVRFCFADSSYINPAGARPGGTLPTIIQSIGTNGLVYRRAPSRGNNCLRIDQQNSQQLTGTLVFQTPTPCQIIKVLATEGNGSNPPQADKVFTLNFTDGTSQTSAGTIVPDWFATTQNAVTVFAYHVGSRVNYTTDGIEATGNNPTLFEVNIPISTANTGKLVRSITVVKVQQAGENNTQFTDPVLNIMGVSVVQSCIPPTSTVTASSTAICPGTSVALTAALAGGTPNVPGQWQSAVNGAAFTNITGATALTYTATPGVTTQYRFSTICTALTHVESLPVTVTVGVPGATLGYDAVTYCHTGKSGTPAITPATAVGGVFAVPTGLVLDASTGVIDLAASTPGTYTIRYTGPAPCLSQATATVTIKSDEPPVFPNVITPNGDGFNDGLVFKFKYPISDISGFKMEVYNRWGRQVWKGTDPAVGWAAEKTGPGQYFYLVDFTDCVGKKQHYKGNVEVIK